MSRKRLTREDSRDQTTQRPLDAAQKLIARKGLSAASVEDIAAAAGYSRGAFYSNFSSKGDLFIELLRRDHAKAHAALDALRDDTLSLDHIQSGLKLTRLLKSGRNTRALPMIIPTARANEHDKIAGSKAMPTTMLRSRFLPGS